MQGARKTLLFQNVYLERIRCVSWPLLRKFGPSLAALQDHEVGDATTALRWFRGHDVGHAWRHATTNFKQLRQLGKAHSFALQEALCDVLGVLALLGPWRVPHVTAGGTMTFYLAEMLRFLSRAEGIHPDFEAAYIVFSYLEQHGYLDVDARLRLHSDPDRLEAGVREISRLLVRGVLGGDFPVAEMVLRRYGPAGSLRSEHSVALLREIRTSCADMRYRNID